MTFLKRFVSPVVTFCFITLFIFQSSLPIYAAQGNLLNLPEPGQMISLSPKYVPAYVKGISIYPNDPFKFDFIIDTGNTNLNDQQFKEESNKLIKYFMAALTVPEKEDWVNLSPYEKDRIVPESLGITDMGRDMLAQDYILKQLTSSLIYPEKEIGKEFWSKVYAQAQKQFGTTNISVNTFNKVWIVPSQAVVWEHDNSAYVVRSHLKVMLEQDYLSLNKHLNNNIFNGSSMDQKDAQATSTVGSEVVRAIVLPALEKEVNEGANFATLRQVFNSAILAAWYKQNLKQSILGQVYANKDKVTGIDLADRQIKQKIYERYLEAFKKGAFNFIKEDADPMTHQAVPRKYFSGGESMDVDGAMTTLKGLESSLAPDEQGALRRKVGVVTAELANAGQATIGADAAMLHQDILGETPSLGITSAELARRIGLELQNPGQGNQPIPVVAAISDQHGTIDKFDQLLVNILRSVPAGQRIPEDFVLQPNRQLAGQLSDLGISLNDFKDQLFIHNLGDLMDRGDSGVAVYKRSRELIDAGISDFIDGNHDQWMFMNLLGFHLPTYDGFNFYGYTDEYDATEGNVKVLLAEKHATDAQNTRDQLWWAEKLAEFRNFQSDQQKTIWTPVAAKVKELTGQITTGMSPDEKKAWDFTEVGRTWGKFRGYNPDVGGDVQTGVRAVGLVSIKWWEELLKQFRDELPGLAGTSKAEVWNQAIDIMANQIIPVLKADLQRELQEGKWWWRIFEAINYKNNDSPEWWSQDWVYHAGWGDSVLKEINNLEHEGKPVVTTANYLTDPTLQAIGRFYQQNYTLHVRDIYQTDYMHAFLPVDFETGEFNFKYKGIEYRGDGRNGVPSYREGLAKIAEDVRNAPVGQGFNPDIYEALSLVNSWYADATTIAKPSHVADAFNKVGVQKLAEANGISILVTGHIPLHDFLRLTTEQRKVITGFRVSSPDGKHHFIFSDHGMGNRFGGGGKYIRLGAKGVNVVGLAGKNSSSIEVDAPTVLVDGEGNERTIYENHPIDGTTFLEGVASNIQANSRAATGSYVAPDAAGNLDPAQVTLTSKVFAEMKDAVNQPLVRVKSASNNGTMMSLWHGRALAYWSARPDRRYMTSTSPEFTIARQILQKIVTRFPQLQIMYNDAVFEDYQFLVTMAGVGMKESSYLTTDRRQLSNLKDRILSYLTELEQEASATMLSDATGRAYETKDSRGRPTVEFELTLNGITVTGDVPAGASTGKGEALTVAVPQAINNIQTIIMPMLQAANIDLGKHTDLIRAENRIIAAAGENFRTLGANATLPVSRALWEMAARIHGMSVAKYIRKFVPEAVYDKGEGEHGLGLFYLNVFNGGLHALKPGEELGVDRIDAQEIMIVPVGARTYAEQLEMGDKIDFELKKILTGEYGADRVTRGDESGFTVKGLGDTDVAIDYVVEAIEKAGYTTNQVRIALDIATGSFYNGKTGTYKFKGEERTTQWMIEYYKELEQRLEKKYGRNIIYTLEDGLDEEDWNGWVDLTKVMKPLGTGTVGDDLFVTQMPRLQKGIKLSAATHILIKQNQNGTMWGTLQTIAYAKKAGMGSVISHRSGETLNTQIADIAYATRSNLKSGDPEPDYDFTGNGQYASKIRVRRPKFERVIELERADAATLAATTTAHPFDPTGGINLDASMMNLQVMRDGKGMVLPISQQPIGEFMKVKGFTPVFINIQRNINLPARLGLNLNETPKEQLASQAASVTG